VERGLTLTKKHRLMQDVAFWVMTFHSEDGGTKFLQNIGILPRHYTASPPRDLDLNIYPSPTHFTLKMDAAWTSETLVSRVQLRRPQLESSDVNFQYHGRNAILYGDASVGVRYTVRYWSIRSFNGGNFLFSWLGLNLERWLIVVCRLWKKALHCRSR
jgi:hypothetical protein